MPPATESSGDAPARARLSRQRVLRAAVSLADREGLEALTMRRLAGELGVEAMSLYHHVANKEAILDGVIEVVTDEVMAAVGGADAPAPQDDWQAAMRARILAARTVLLRHPWAPRVLETRTAMSPTLMGYYDGVLGIFRAGGFDWDLAHQAMHALGSRALGFTQELFQPDDAEADDAETLAMFEQMGEQFPHLVGMLAEIVHDDPDRSLGWCDDQREFEFGLDVLLEGLERRRAAR
ncbi:MAG TPA: TetR/AcrR family transcriptional regulator C-terminal domain-containing protein [Egicoccus sp.]|nr:TetR/AcrR family transcriptional regulator C-terminal domain-containing protein [Egicoccus sp.]HSK23347.1 TetR/AcrR family transcriptional regulator C-terminal domain-containing protein [Egicoccus sp.]